uniref:Uncharacterized protein n=1 Tax=Meleagris gallopavo TaxID=9103 RepID=A0A803XWD2_MELGA
MKLVHVALLYLVWDRNPPPAPSLRAPRRIRQPLEEGNSLADALFVTRGPAPFGLLLSRARSAALSQRRD